MAESFISHQNIHDQLGINVKIETDEWSAKSDAEIWREYKKGGRSALIYIYTRYFSVLFNYAIQFEQNRENVKDAVQELFIYLYKHRESINETNSIKYYLFKCLRRRIKVEKEKFLRTRQYHLADQFSFEGSPEHEFILQEDELRSKEILKNAISKLSPKQREIIYYFYYEGFSYNEITGIMGFSQVKSARKLLYRAIDSLKSLIDFSTFLTIFISIACLFVL
jgi:RNA polymerase sigma factor (sigma-70 family)